MIVLGSQFYRADADAMRRQERAMRALAGLHGVIPINLQWPDDVYERPELETVATLRHDAQQVTPLPGRRKPIVPELFDALADVADARGCRYFGFLNADIEVLPSAVEMIVSEARDCWAFSRRDFDGTTGADLRVLADGLDLFVFDVAWWRAHRHRLRPYILGEWFYDSVIGGMMMRHGRGLIENREGHIRHEEHKQGPQGPQAAYNGYLAALDSPYLSIWVKYRFQLDAARARGASEAEELALQRAPFGRRPSLAASVWHAGRSVKARWLYRRRRLAWRG